MRILKISKRNRTSNMELFCENRFNWYPFSQKSFIVDVPLGSKYAFAFFVRSRKVDISFCA